MDLGKFWEDLPRILDNSLNVTAPRSCPQQEVSLILHGLSPPLVSESGMFTEKKI